MALPEPMMVPLWVLGLLAPAMLWLELQAAPAETRARQWPVPVWLLHLGVLCLGFAALLLLVQRPWFAGMLLLAGGLVLVLVNNAKYHALREPFLFHDFSYFTSAIRYPRLYLPFLGLGRAVLAVMAGVAVLGAGIWLEPAMAEAWRWAVLFGALGMVSLGGIWHWRPTLTLEPAADVRKLGLWGSLWAYWRRSRSVPEIDAQIIPGGGAKALHEKALHEKALHQKALHEKDLNQPALMPDLLVVQSESFFDPRSEYPYVRNELLAEFDQACASARYCGRLRVPAWGANTVRAECGFLTGLPPGVWDVHQFNPYRILPRVRVVGLARMLKDRGYHTVCVHPYAAGFYQRDRAMRYLGFDRFIDISAFSQDDYCGQYVGDRAVTEQVLGLLRDRADTAVPLFVFVITMENHGPLHLDRPDDLDEGALYDVAPAPDWRELSSYLYHLRHADQMIALLRQALMEQERPGVLAWYGDHVPIIPAFYQRYGVPKGETDYFIWTTRDDARNEVKNVAVHDLNGLVFRTLLDA